MSVSFSPTNNFNKDSSCIICSEPLKKGKVVIHDGMNGPKHPPFHKECIRSWIKKSSKCPFCREKVNVESLLTRNERLIMTIRSWSFELFLTASGILTGIMVGQIGAVPEETPERLIGRVILGATAGISVSIILETAGKALGLLEGSLRETLGRII